jgi:rhodanese-related sulfurtransferase
MKTKFWTYLAVLLFLLNLLFTAGCTLATTQAVSSPVTTITPAYVVPKITAQEAYNLIQENMGNPDFIILDVRTPDEFISGYIAGAINIDYYSPEFRANISKLDQDKQYVVYCRTDNRSTATVRLMLDLGFEKMQNFSGGITQWIQNGYPTVK